MDATPLAFTWIGRGWTWVGLLLDGTSDGHPMIWSWESEFYFIGGMEFCGGNP